MASVSPRRHSDYDVLYPEDVHPRGRASFDQLRKAYNLTSTQAVALSLTTSTHGYLNSSEVQERTRRSIVKRCPTLFRVVDDYPVYAVYPSHAGKAVARALADALDWERALHLLGRWLRS